MKPVAAGEEARERHSLTTGGGLMRANGGLDVNVLL